MNNLDFVFPETGFLCGAPAVLGLTLVDQAGLEIRDPPASGFAYNLLGLKLCVATTWLYLVSLRSTTGMVIDYSGFVNLDLLNSKMFMSWKNKINVTIFLLWPFNTEVRSFLK